MGKTIKLKHPITQGSEIITEIKFPDRRIKAGDLRGTSLRKLQEGDTDSLLLVVGRLTGHTPSVMQEIDAFDDLENVLSAAFDFLPKEGSPKIGNEPSE
ncbi:phage tail assembly protein [Desulfocurvibacter africanus]|uniref:Phage tail assembly protein n=1 Tax=Desulfocurvibacter africanus subsp. africanus str. Walvis Bay TaxID=690850 RepID=F3Z2T6_DESAF|nr:phage tail assembly protein [Desulfocurvibacter africanus]EGJ50253.1 hypothetical protein Desaf_1924 [Desulfocurvibacter africanus subsp. africanus str. Walvis Bay]